MPTCSPTVLLVTGDDALHEELADVLASTGFTVCGRCRSTAALLDAARRSRPEIAVLDVRATGDVLEAISALHREALTESVVLMADVDECLLADVITRGAAGAVAVDDLPSLPASLRAVLAGESALSRKLVARLLVEYRVRDAMARGDGPLAVLSRREREVLELLRRGRTTQEVATELFLEPVTVRSHVASAVRHLGVATREEALRLLGGGDPARPGDGGARAPAVDRVPTRPER